ncbi:MAG: hypothetical protein V1723_03045 [Candidatus Uhrbacteria bacterium]
MNPAPLLRPKVVLGEGALSNSRGASMRANLGSFFAITAITVAFLGCGHTRIASPAGRNSYGDFESESHGLGTNPGEQWRQFAEGARDIEMARADRAYIESLNATAQWYAQQGEAEVAATRAPEQTAMELLAALPRSPLRLASLTTPRCALMAALCTDAQTRIETVFLRERRAIILKREYLDAALRQQSFQISESFDDATSVVLGRFVGATHLLVVDLFPSLREVGYVLETRVIDVTTGAAIAASQQAFKP